MATRARAAGRGACGLLIALVLSQLTACGLFESRPPPVPLPEPAERARPARPPPPPVDDASRLRTRLYQHYELWKGAPYRLGGLTTRGVDCSGFVLVTFKSMLHIDLPRTADEQALVGQSVPRTQLRTGDLLFFRTGMRERHVGIYLEQGRFMHASRRRGVMISALDNGYWSRRFWQARRIQD